MPCLPLKPSGLVLAVSAVLAAMVCGCAPALNWRELALPGTVIVALFPCKPVSVTRDIALVGQRVPMQLLSCDADNTVWAVASAPLIDPASVAPALLALRTQAASHIQAPLQPVQAWAVPGATPNAATGRVVLRGLLPDGRRVVEHQGLFVYGTQVFQASVIGGQLNDEAVGSFFEGVRVRP